MGWTHVGLPSSSSRPASRPPPPPSRPTHSHTHTWPLLPSFPAAFLLAAPCRGLFSACLAQRSPARDPGQPEDSGSTRRQLPGSLETGGGGSAASMSRRYRVVRTPVINRGPADTAASLSRDSAWEPGWLRLVSTILIWFRFFTKIYIL